MAGARYIKLYPENPDPRQLKIIAETLRKGGLIVYPTDTVYGLGCDITNSKALQRLAQLKGVRLEKAKWSFVCADLSNLSDFTRQLDNSTFKLLKRCLPGPYTFILEGNNDLPKEFKKKKTVGIRVPNHSIPQAIVRELGNPIVSTSIHDTDEILDYTTDPELIYEEWKQRVDLVIDGGFGGNIPSTIIDASGEFPELIRVGKGNPDVI